MSETFDIAIDVGRVFRFEPGPGRTAYVDPEAAPDSEGRVVALPDGRRAKQVQVSRFEAVLSVSTWRIGEDGPRRLDDVDEIAGFLAEDDVPLVQLRVLPPPPGVWPQYPVMLAGDPAPEGHGAVRDRVEAGIAALAPEGWRAFTVECRATARRMEVEATVTSADGTTRPWSPPVMVGQWLHRLRLCDYRSTIGVWSTARLAFSADGAVERHFDIEHKPAWRVPQGFGEEYEHYADELRLLPRRPEAVHPWLFEGAAKVQQHGLARFLSHPDRTDDEPGVVRIARLFDEVGEDERPAWYRPMIGGRERHLVLEYLDNAPLVLASRGMGRDVLSAGEDDRTVPLGFHTDGRWVWSSAVAHYLRHHHVPPAPALVDHIRQQRYRLPDDVPSIAKGRAAALAMDRPDPESRITTAFEDALAGVFVVIRDCQTSPRFYSLGRHQDLSWCLVREDDWYVVYWAEEGERRNLVRFADVKQAAAYLCGQLRLNEDSLRFEVDEELPWWQAPFTVLSDRDVPLREFEHVVLTVVEDLVVDRFGTPDGNSAYAVDTPFEQRGVPADHAGREHHRYRLLGQWKVITAVSPAGGRLYVVPQSFAEHLAAGHVEELPVPTAHPGLPPVTDALRAEARRNPGGWVWCGDPDVDPRFIEGLPDSALLGAYRVGPDGELTGETFVNPGYRPSPRRRGFPEPQTDFEAVLGFVAAGWLPHDRLPRAALDGTFLVESDGTGNLRVGVDGAGRRFLAVHTSPRHLPPSAANAVQVTGRALLPVLAGAVLVINPGADFGVELPGDDLIAAAG